MASQGMINILSELLKDRKNKFLFVGEGNFTFTVAFNAYRQSLRNDYSLIGTFEEQCSLQDHNKGKKYTPHLIVLKLIRLHEFSITR